MANAPEANSVAAAEHTMAIVLALCRNVAQARQSLAEGRWTAASSRARSSTARPSASPASVASGKLVAKMAQGFDMELIGYDKFVTAERFRELGVEGVESPEELFGGADFISLHLPKTPETIGFVDAEAIGQMRDGVRIVNCARGELIDLDALVEGLESGKVAGAALDVFPEEPFTEHPVLARDDVVVTPHLGASTAEAQDRAGVVTAEQVTAALTGGVVTTAVNIAAVRPEVMEILAPFVPLCEKLGRLAQGLGDGSLDKIEVEFRGRLAEEDTRLLGISVLAGILKGHTEEAVNLVNAPHLAEQRGLELVERAIRSRMTSPCLVTVRIHSGDSSVEVSGTGVGPRNEPYLVGLWNEGFYLPFADHLAVFRYADQPGMIGLVGSIFGEEGVNIISAAVGASTEGGKGSDGADHRRSRQPRHDRADRGARGLRGRPRRVSLATGIGSADEGRRLTRTGDRRCCRCRSSPTPWPVRARS